MDDARIKLVEANPNNQPAGKPIGSKIWGQKLLK